MKFFFVINFCSSKPYILIHYSSLHVMFFPVFYASCIRAVLNVYLKVWYKSYIIFIQELNFFYLVVVRFTPTIYLYNMLYVLSKDWYISNILSIQILKFHTWMVVTFTPIIECTLAFI